MPCQNEELRCELVAMAALDLEIRENLIRCGIIFDGYHPEMEAIRRSTELNSKRIVRASYAHICSKNQSASRSVGVKSVWNLSVKGLPGRGYLQSRLTQLASSASIKHGCTE